MYIGEKRMTYSIKRILFEGDTWYMCPICHIFLAAIRYDGKIIFLESCKHFKWRKTTYHILPVTDPKVVLDFIHGTKVYLLVSKQK